MGLTDTVRSHSRYADRVARGMMGSLSDSDFSQDHMPLLRKTIMNLLFDGL